MPGYVPLLILLTQCRRPKTARLAGRHQHLGEEIRELDAALAPLPYQLQAH